MPDGDSGTNPIESTFVTVGLPHQRTKGNRFFIEDPAKSQTDAGKIHFPDWRAIAADVLIKGTYSKTGDQLKVEFYLYDVFREKQVEPQCVRIGRREYHVTYWWRSIDRHGK